MIWFYVCAFLIGGILLGWSALGGGDSDADLDGDFDADADADADGDGDHSSGDLSPEFLWFPYASVRFWTFFLAFAGLAGTLVTLFNLLPALPTGVFAGVIGYVCGLGASWVVRKLQREVVDSSLSASDYVGATGEVLLPLDGTAPGKVRINIKGRIVDFTAKTDSEEFDIDDAVMVYAVEDDGTVMVTRAKKTNK